MNKNLVKYPIRFGTLLLAGAALVACKKEEFTEKDALALEQSRLTFLNDQKNANALLAEKERARMITWQRNLDSLDRINAGGRVYYTVIPVNATEAVLAGGGNSHGGRTEETFPTTANLTVTATQYGKVWVAAGDGAKNGVFTFPDMRSGEVTVNVTATGFTEVSYISNLTPDGGIPNNGVVNVGNIVPLFETAATGQKMSVIKGKAWFEGDLTNVFEETLGEKGILVGTNENVVTANIDVTRNDGTTGGLPYFHQRFLLESNGEGSNSFGVGVKSGAIQRFSYNKAVAYSGPVTAGTAGSTTAAGTGGDYTMLVPSSVAGLPIRLNFSEFAFNRTYYNDASQVITNERFLYGPNVTPSDVPNPSVTLPTFRVFAFNTEATATAAFTPQVTGAQPTSFEKVGITDAGATAVNRIRGGFYAIAPTVTVTAAPGTGATFSAVFDNTVSRANTAALYQGVTNAANQTAFETSFKRVARVNVLTAGSGYTSNSAITVTRNDIIGSVGFGGQVATGGGATGGYVSLSTTTPIQVTDGGANFLSSSVVAGGISTPNTFTNYLPTVVFTETDQPSAADPVKGYIGLNPTITDASARVFVDYNTGYINPNFNGVTPAAPNFANGGVGSIQEVQFTSAGSYPSAKLPFVNFSFGQTIESGGNVNNTNLFLSNGAGGVKFNNGINPADYNTFFAGAGVAGITATDITFTVGTGGWGSRYTFVPSVRIAPITSTAAKATGLENALRNVTVTPFVDNNPGPGNASFGKIIKLSITSNNALGTGSGVTVGALDNDFMITAPFSTTSGVDQLILKVEPQRYGNTLRALGTPNGTAQTQAIGTALNTYSYNVAPAVVTQATALATAVGGAVSNTMQANGATGVSVTTADLLRDNNMLVVFSAPNVTTAANNRFAWGVPVWNGNILTGARIIDGGSGYNAPVSIPASGVNFTSTVTASLVPNPWFKTNVPVAGVAMPSNVTSAVSAISSITTAQDIIGFLNHPTMMLQGRADRFQPTITAAKLVLTVSGGDGYSRAPRFIVSGGGLNLVEYNAGAGSMNGVSTSQGGVITFNSRIDATGKVTQIWNPSSIGYIAPVPAIPTTGGVAQSFDASTGNDIINTFEFPIDNAPNYSGALTVTTVEELSNALTYSLNAATNATTTAPNNLTGNQGVGATAILGSTGTGNTATGTVAAVRFGRNVANSAATTADLSPAIAANTPMVDIQNLTGTPVAGTTLVPGPRVTVVGGGATTAATVTSYVTLDPNSPLHRRITRIAVLTPGSGYGLQRINSYTRALGGGTNESSQNANAGQLFKIVGGSMNGTQPGQGGQAQTQTQFDTYPGLTYVRDVHYGTGVRLD